MLPKTMTLGEVCAVIGAILISSVFFIGYAVNAIHEDIQDRNADIKMTESFEVKYLQRQFHPNPFRRSSPQFSRENQP